MFQETVDKLAGAATAKAQFLRKSPLRYLAAASLAGIFVGLGIILIFSVGAPLAAGGSPAVKLVMGVSFGIALTLVIIAGSELFTGLNMIMTFGFVRKTVGTGDVLLIWLASWIGNLIGSLAIAWLFSRTGFMKGEVLSNFVNSVVFQKMNAPWTELLARAIACNMLVCLAVWMSFRVNSDAAKLGVIFWCLFAFISSGFEHSIANMSLLAIPLFSAPAEGVTWLGYFRNLFIVTAGNMIGGALVIGGLYAFISVKREKAGVKP